MAAAKASGSETASDTRDNARDNARDNTRDNTRAPLTLTTSSDREIVVTRVFDAPRRLVFDAWTNPEHLPHWMLGPSGWTMPVCEIDLRPGGAWRFVWRQADGTEMEMHGVYQEVVPPDRLAELLHVIS